MKAQLHEHQREAVAKMHNGCVLHGDVGTGKTITSLGYALEKEPYRKIVVVTTAKVRDSLAWEKEAAKLMIPVDNIEVTSWNKINDLVGYEGKFFIFDEQRLVGAGAWVKAFQKIARKNHWILLSATPGDTWSDYAPMFIANGWYKNITEFRREHAVYSRYTNFPKIERWINEGKLQKYRKRLLVKMPMARHTTRHMHYIECDYDQELLDIVRKKRWNVYEDKPILNAAELFGVMRKVVSSDPDRLSQMENLVRTHPRLIVFYNYNYELDILRQMCERFEQNPSGLYTPMTPPNGSVDWTTRSNGQGLPQEFLDSLPPWELTDEEMMSALDQWLTSNTSPEERTESWESKTPTTSSPTTAPSLSTSTTVRPSSTPPPTTPPTRTSAGRSTTQDVPSTRTEKTRSSADVLQPVTRPTSRESVPPTTAQEPSSRPRSEQPSRSAARRPPADPACPKRDSSSSTTSTIYLPSQKEQDEILSSSGTSGSTKTSTDSLSLASTTDSFSWAEWNGHKHQEVPDTDRWVYLVQYASGSEGWNCIDTDAMAFWSLTYSYKQFWQSQGRIDRLNTPFSDLHYHILMTNSPAEKPVLASLGEKKDFQPR